MASQYLHNVFTISTQCLHNIFTTSSQCLHTKSTHCLYNVFTMSAQRLHNIFTKSSQCLHAKSTQCLDKKLLHTGDVDVAGVEPRRACEGHHLAVEGHLQRDGVLICYRTIVRGDQRHRGGRHHRRHLMKAIQTKF